MAPQTPAESNNTTNSSASSPLMKLPAELRITVYEYALRLDNDGIFQVSGINGIPEPALLLTNKAIRREALPVFYSQNSIFLVVDSYSPAMPLFVYKKQLSALAQYDCKIAVWQVMPRGPARWRNLLAWLRLAHEQEYVGIPFTRLESPLGTGGYKDWAGDPLREWTVVAGLFQMVALLNSSEWDVVEETLGLMRYALVKFNAEWEVD